MTIFNNVLTIIIYYVFIYINTFLQKFFFCINEKIKNFIVLKQFINIQIKKVK